jgi:hypothetical protein
MTSGLPKHSAAELSHTEYLTLIYRLGLTPCGRKTAKYLGLSVRQLQRIYQRQSKIPRPVALLLSLYAEITAQNAQPKQPKITLTPRIKS